MRILITGGKGNIGGRLAARLVERGEEVTLFDIRDHANENLPAARECRTVIGDISDQDNFFEAFSPEGFDSIFHLRRYCRRTRRRIRGGPGT